MNIFGALGVLQAKPKFLLLFERTSLWELSPTKSVPKLHIHLSSCFFNSFSCSQQSTKTTCNAAMASSKSPWWHSPKCLVSPQAVQLALLMSPLSFVPRPSSLHVFSGTNIVCWIATVAEYIIYNIYI